MLCRVVRPPRFPLLRCAAGPDPPQRVKTAERGCWTIAVMRKVMSSRRDDMKPGDGIAEFFSDLAGGSTSRWASLQCHMRAVPRTLLGFMPGRGITTFFQVSLA